MTDAWGTPISCIRVTEDKNNNVVGIFNDTVEYHTLYKSSIDEIKRIIKDNKEVFEIDSDELYHAPLVLDGYRNHFNFEYEDEDGDEDYYLNLEVGNYAYMYDDERLMCLRKLFESIADYLISKGVSKELFMLKPAE